MLLVTAMTRHEDFEIVVAWFNAQALKRAVEVVDRAGVIPVDKNLGLTRSNLQSY